RRRGGPRLSRLELSPRPHLRRGRRRLPARLPDRRALDPARAPQPRGIGVVPGDAAPLSGRGDGVLDLSQEVPARPVARGARRRAPPHADVQASRAALRRPRAGMEAQLPDDALPRGLGGAEHPPRDGPVERHRLARARGGGLHRTLPLALLADRALPGAAPPRPAAAARVKKLATLLLLVLAGSTAAQLHVSRQTY